MPPRGSLRIHVCAPLHVGGCQRPRPLPPLEKWRFVETAVGSAGSACRLVPPCSCPKKLAPGALRLEGIRNESIVVELPSRRAVGPGRHGLGHRDGRLAGSLVDACARSSQSTGLGVPFSLRDFLSPSSGYRP